jgi:WD40 repeat protein
MSGRTCFALPRAVRPFLWLLLVPAVAVAVDQPTAPLVTEVWEVPTGKLLRQLQGYANSVRSVAFSPDGKFALLGSRETPRLWDLRTGKPLPCLPEPVWKQDEQPGPMPVEYCLSPDTRLAFVNGADRTVQLWDLSTGKLLHVLGNHPSSTNVWGYSDRILLSQRHIPLHAEPIQLT